MTILRSISSLNITSNSNIINNNNLSNNIINKNENIESFKYDQENEKNKISEYETPQPTYFSLASGLSCTIL